MEKKEKPIVPLKPKPSSVAEKARNFEKIAAECTTQKPNHLRSFRIPKNVPKSPDTTEVITLNSDNDFVVDKSELLVNLDYTLPVDTTKEEFNTDNASEDSSDDSIYHDTPENFGDHIYDDISEETGVFNTVEEILTNEKNYIDRLNYCVDNYVESSRLMGEQMNAVFGNIEEIKYFHENIFYPDLISCNKDLVRILECFSKHAKAGHFYIYIVYSMNKKRSDDESCTPAFKSFFEECRKKIGDKLGLQSLLTEPFQRIFKYQNLIESVLSKLQKSKLNFMEIAAASKALHDVKKLLNTANMSMALTDIVNSKINLTNQGNFLTQNEFNIVERIGSRDQTMSSKYSNAEKKFRNIVDDNHKRKYKGNIFLFQNCVVCTERISTGKLQFKGYFPSQSSHIECINENKFMLYEGNNYKIEVSGEAYAIQQMMGEVRKVLTATIMPEDIRNSSILTPSTPSVNNLESLIKDSYKRHTSADSLNCDYSDKESMLNVDVENRSISDCSSGSSGEFVGTQSENEKQQFKQMIKNIERFYEKVSVNTPSPSFHEEATLVIIPDTSTDIILEMLTNERNYVEQLNSGIQAYLPNESHNITEAFRETILKIFGVMQQIRDFHENSVFCHLKNCDNDITQIANVFIKFSQEGLFNSYILYAKNHSDIQSLRILRTYREYFEARQRNLGIDQGVEHYLFLPFKHLSNYQSYMDRIINTLNIDTDKAKMAACSIAIKNIERLIKDMLTSWSPSENVQVRRRPMRKLSALFMSGIQNMRRH